MLEKKVITKFKKLVPEAKVPTYAKDGDAGADICAIANYIVAPGKSILVKTGIAIALPKNHEAQVRSKSGIALKAGVFVLNSPGTVDEGYRGEIGVILYNTSDEEYVISAGDKVAQLVIKPVYQSTFVEVDELDETDRNDKGFGSTGVKNK